MKYNTLNLLCLLCAVLFLYSCAAAPEKADTRTPQEIKPSLPETGEIPLHTEEESKSLKLFSEVLDIVESGSDRQSVLPEIEKIYGKIIREYPDAPLAQESYWKLITIYVEDYSPPAYDRAEMRYHEFLEKYPASFLRAYIEDTLGNSYYKNREWQRLLKLSEPAYRAYIENEPRPRPSMLFMYAEARYNLGYIDEAVKVYKIVKQLYPRLIVGIKSGKMLDRLQKGSP